jgi:hypothetical protein
MCWWTYSDDSNINTDGSLLGTQWDLTQLRTPYGAAIESEETEVVNGVSVHGDDVHLFLREKRGCRADGTYSDDVAIGQDETLR